MRRATLLEWATVFVIVAVLSAFWLNRFEASMQAARESWMRVAVAQMRLGMADGHLLAVREGVPFLDGERDMGTVRVTFSGGYPAATTDGIGKLMPLAVGQLRLACRTRGGAASLVFECSPDDLSDAARERCAIRYFGAARAREAATVEFRLDGDRACRSEG